MLTTLIDGMLESAEEQYENLQLARQRPHVLDDYTVGRVITVYTSQRNDLSLYDEQVQRWQAETLTDEQREDLKHLVSHGVCGAMEQESGLRDSVTTSK